MKKFVKLISRKKSLNMYYYIYIKIYVLFLALVLFGLLWFNRKNEPEEEWEAFTESLFLVVKVRNK